MSLARSPGEAGTGLEGAHEIEATTLCDEPDAPLKVKLAVYLIAQEALHNTVFRRGDDFPGHPGLHSMRERAERLVGTLEAGSVPGTGTRISARIPAKRTDTLASRHRIQVSPIWP